MMAFRNGHGWISLRRSLIPVALAAVSAACGQGYGGVFGYVYRPSEPVENVSDPDRSNLERWESPEPAAEPAPETTTPETAMPAPPPPSPVAPPRPVERPVVSAPPSRAAETRPSLAAPATRPSPDEPSVTEKLRALDRLHARGLISTAEYESRRSRLRQSGGAR